jgi:hypothetical protein
LLNVRLRLVIVSRATSACPGWEVARPHLALSLLVAGALMLAQPD